MCNTMWAKRVADRGNFDEAREMMAVQKQSLLVSPAKGSPMVQGLVEDIAKMSTGMVDQCEPT